uniref:Uncharacterized protein n=1 Tax=Cacopsylla melanoneura TaxID=428564 RepID=A0A8D8LMF6_9HEMI
MGSLALDSLRTAAKWNLVLPGATPGSISYLVFDVDSGQIQVSNNTTCCTTLGKPKLGTKNWFAYIHSNYQEVYGCNTRRRKKQIRGEKIAKSPSVRLCLYLPI